MANTFAGNGISLLAELLPTLESLPEGVGSDASFIVDELGVIHSDFKEWAERSIPYPTPLSLAMRRRQDFLLYKQAADLDSHVVDVIDEFRVSISGAHPWGRMAASLGSFVAKIISKGTTAMARRKFAGDIRNARRLVEELLGRQRRYDINFESILLNPGRLEDKDVHKKSRVGVAEVLPTLPMIDDLRKLGLPSWAQADIAFLRLEMEFVGFVLSIPAEVPEDELDEGTKPWAEDLRKVVLDIGLAVNKFESATAARDRRQFAAKIRELKHCLLEVSMRQDGWYDSGSAGARLDPASGRVAIDGHGDASSGSAGARLDPASLVAIEGHRDFLIKLLTDEASTSSGLQLQQLRVASIVGVAGVGKTTLAKEVHRVLAPQFDCAAWVSLPALPKPDIKTVLYDLLQQISKPPGQPGAAPRANGQPIGAPPETMDLEESFIEKIRDTLEGKRYFVVVENIRDSKSWDTMKRALIENNTGSVVLTTSHKADFAPEYIYKLEPLSGPDSKRLFYERFLFHSNATCSSELAEKSERLIETCGGIPLAIITAADLLANKPQAVEDSGDYEPLLNQIRGIVAQTYTGIPYRLKHCLFYFSMFRKSYVISSERLVMGWIAEGFIPGSQRVGEKYLNELIKRNFIEAVEVDAAGKALFCRVYDWVHESIIFKATKEKIANILDGRQDTFSNKVRRLSIQGSSLKQPLPQELSRMRSLVVSGDVSMPSLSDFKELRALDLGGCDCLLDDHLRGIGNSCHLKYLVIGGNLITGIPEEIVNLSSLQTLDLRESGLNVLPKCIYMLTQLERLFVSSHTKIPDGLGKMAALQELGDINVSKAELLKELCSLANLRILRLAIWSWDESLEMYDAPLLEYLRSLVQDEREIQCLSISTSSSLEFMDQLGDEWAPPNLHMLEMKYSAFDKSPRWLVSLQELSSLSIEVYNLSQEIIDMLGKLPSLCYLYLTSKNAPQGKFGGRVDESGGGRIRESGDCTDSFELVMYRGDTDESGEGHIEESEGHTDDESGGGHVDESRGHIDESRGGCIDEYGGENDEIGEHSTDECESQIDESRSRSRSLSSTQRTTPRRRSRSRSLSTSTQRTNRRRRRIKGTSGSLSNFGRRWRALVPRLACWRARVSPPTAFFRRSRATPASSPSTHLSRGSLAWPVAVYRGSRVGAPTGGEARAGRIQTRPRGRSGESGGDHIEEFEERASIDEHGGDRSVESGGGGAAEFAKLTGLHFASNAMGTIFASESKSLQMLKRLRLSFHVSRTKGVNQDFDFGLEHLSSLEHVHVEMNCFNASRQEVEKSEDAIKEAISRDRSRRPVLEIRRVQEENMLEEVVIPCDRKQEEHKEEATITKKRYYIC